MHPRFSRCASNERYLLFSEKAIQIEKGSELRARPFFRRTPPKLLEKNSSTGLKGFRLKFNKSSAPGPQELVKSESRSSDEDDDVDKLIGDEFLQLLGKRLFEKVSKPELF